MSSLSTRKSWLNASYKTILFYSSFFFFLFMIDIDSLLVPYRAKLVERKGMTGNRAELLILYHDMVEIKSGDVFILDEEARVGKYEREAEAVKELAVEFPVEIRKELLSCFDEYVVNETWEAKFAHAVDALDPILHSFEDYPAWKKYGFTAATLREKKLVDVEPFPELVEFFEELIKIQVEKGVVPRD